jgi:hypothetical protein
MEKEKVTKAKTTNGKPKAKTNGKNKSELARALLRRPSGASREAILKCTGWPTVSVQALCKNRGTLTQKPNEEGVLIYRLKSK